MGYRFAAEYNHAQERLYTCHFYAIFAGPRFVEIQKYCFLPWQRDVTTSLSIRKETCLPLVRFLLFSLNKFSVIYNYQNYWGEDKTWTRGPWPPTLDRVHMDHFHMDRVQGPSVMDQVHGHFFFNNEK